MHDLIQPRLLKGFRDILPEEEMNRREVEAVLEREFRLFGFVPVDSPILEYADVLLGKGGGATDKEVYRFEDHGGRDIAMRFDLTVPFARYMAMHGSDLPRPFKRYQMAKVWRGEKPQKGRYREFVQCDFDVVGADHMAADLEVLLLMDRSLTAIGVEGFTIHVGHRGLLNRCLAQIGVAEHATELLRIVDKMRKIGAEAVTAELTKFVDAPKARLILEMITPEASFVESLRKLEDLAGGGDENSRRIEDIHAIIADSPTTGRFLLDPSITRGLDYYTGIVFETYLSKNESFGSICSGGRYNDLASLYSSSPIPGVGASIGLDRLMAALSQIDTLPHPVPVPRVAVFNLEDRLLAHYFGIARTLREAGISCDICYSKGKLASQFKRAEKAGSEFAIICGESEHDSRTVNLKNLVTRQSVDSISISQAVKLILQP